MSMTHRQKLKLKKVRVRQRKLRNQRHISLIVTAKERKAARKEQHNADNRL
jgi:hypothetical protein